MSEQPTTPKSGGHGLAYAEPTLRNLREPLDPVVVRALQWAISFFVTPLHSVMAAVCGAIGIVRTHRLKTRGRGHAYAALAVGLAGTFGWIWGINFIIQVRRMSVQVQCQRQLREIGAGLFAYAGQNGGRYPGRLQDLVPSGVVSSGALACPASGLSAPTGSATSMQTTYVFVAAGMPANRFGANDMILFEVSAHPTGKVSVLYGDGHGLQLTPEQAAAEAQKMVDKIAAMRAVTRPAATRPGV